MTEPFDIIAAETYQKLLSSSITNAHLRDYFNTCFQAGIDLYGMYQCWACTNCLKLGRKTQGWGKPPSKCPECHKPSVYEIATFQARSSVVGNAFASAFSYLMQAHYRLPLIPTPGNTRTHDFEVTQEIAIEAKGSPSSFANPDGSLTRLGNPGMERTDTRKKAFDNAHTYKERNPQGTFFIVSNAISSDHVGYRSRDVTGIFDVTKADRLDAMMMEIEDKIDLDGLRRKRGKLSS
jgi:hypothetical protein